MDNFNPSPSSCPSASMDYRPNDFLNPPQAAGAPRMPQFPLSSPIPEEPADPFEEETQGSDNPFASPLDDAVNDGGDGRDNPASRWSTDSGSVKRHGAWSSTKRLMRSNSKRAQPKKTRPGLNLVTDFSSSSAAPTSKPRQASRGQNGKAFLDLADLADLATVSKSKEPTDAKKNARRLLWKRAAGRACREHSEKPSAVETGKLAGKVRDEISPSDRPIVIGMSVPRGSVGDTADHSIAAHESQPMQSTNHDHDIRDDRTPVTPSIVVTPAIEDSSRTFGWDEDFIQHQSRPSRPPSSAYSQATPRADGGTNYAESIPPVPALPPTAFFAKAEENDDVFAENAATSTRKQRAMSTGTVFEEEVDDDNGSPFSSNSRPRSFSGNDRQGTLSALDTPSRRKSQGWWNYLLSPLLTRSNTVSSRAPQSAHGSPPPLPSIISAQPYNNGGSSNNNLDEKGLPREVSTFSPDTPEETALPADREKSMRSDITRWPDLRSARDGAFNSVHPMRASENKISPLSAASSSQTIPFMMSDSAVSDDGERVAPLQACASDSNPDPYVRSINHTYSPTNWAPGNSPPVDSGGTGGALSNVNGSPPNYNPNNPFFQRFVESLRNPSTARSRSDSESTTFEDDPDVSPTVREANATPMFRADGTSMAPTPIVTTTPIPNVPSDNPAPTELNDSPNSGSQPPPYSPPPQNDTRPTPRYRAIFPPDVQRDPQQPHSPSPVTPVTQHLISGGAGYAMSETPQPPPAAHTRPANNRDMTDSNDLFPAHFSAGAEPITLSDARAAKESRRQRLEREEAYGRRIGGLWRGRGCFSNKGCFGRQGREGRNRRRWYVIMVGILLVIITLSIVLPILLTRKGDSVSVESRWLNLTGYPPMPTGISTIAGPNAAVTRSSCIKPSTMWSCALPKEQQESNKPFDPDRPKFKLQIDFQNGTFDHSTEVASSSDSIKRMRRDGVTYDKADPPPPSLEDMEFLGNTTDNVTAQLFAGEETPFYATFLPALTRSLSSRARHKRAEDGSPTFPNLTSAIPSPDVNPDGTAAPATLYPLPTSQPLRLYDRGLATEHYGFYTYFNRSIFLKSTEPLDPSSDGESEEVPDDLNGGSSKDAARVRCTWAQTRFLVQIWTRPQEAGLVLVGNGTSLATPSATSSSPAPSSSSSSSSSSSGDFTNPWSFPYPITLTLDRHGGVAKDKMVYCYGMDVRGRIEPDEKKLQLEFRGFGGTLVNPANGVFNLTDSEDADDDDGGATGVGIDGGTGGCMCEWRNWQEVV